MISFLVTEKECFQSILGGQRIVAESLEEAKAEPRKMKFFDGTVLTIENSAGLEVARFDGERWFDDVEIPDMRDMFAEPERTIR